MAQMVKNLPATQERDPGSISGSGRSPGEENGYPLQYSCQGITWTEETGRLQSMGLQRVGHNQATNTFTLSLQKITSLEFPWWPKMVKRLSTMWEDLGSIPGSGSSLEKEMATHSSTLPQKIPWTEESGIHGVAKSRT